jgi:hapalindole biogenesis HpiC1 cyclase-like protein/PEP-CTERM motif-containing protein
MTLKKLAVLSAILLSMTVLSGTARADSIPIVNASFESISGTLNIACPAGGPTCAYNNGPIPGWFEIAGGSWQPGTYFSSIPDGNLVGYVNATRSITQELTGQSVQADSTYTFSFFVGSRSDGQSGLYTISLDTILGGVLTTLCTVTGNGRNIPSGTFQQESCSYTSGSSGLPGGDLFLDFTANSGQLDVDNVGLTVQSAASVPEPSSVLLLGVGMFFLMTMLIAHRKKDLRLAA